MSDKHAICEKLVVKGVISNTSPLLISSGTGETEDFEVMLDECGKPFIPASGFAGMIKNTFELLEVIHLEPEFDFFWGSSKVQEVESQSHVIFHDLTLIGDSIIAVRDGVTISALTGTAIKNHKYDYELLEKGAHFDLTMEITIRNGFNKKPFLQYLDYILTCGGGEVSFRQGAFKSSGFGELKWEEAAVYAFELGSKELSKKWFSYLEKNELKNPVYTNKSGWSENYKPDDTLKPTVKKGFRITGEFSIHNSLIIATDDVRFHISGEKPPHKTHLTNSSGEALLTGKSLKGPIRHRALKILNTIKNGKTESEVAGIIDNLFGYVNEKTKEQKPSRVRSYETTIKDASTKQKQPRIKIDRFTGGTIEPALMEIQPLWHEKENISLVFEVSDCTKSEAALMLLVMKDLFTGDLPIGGLKSVGKGFLKGTVLKAQGEVQGYGVLDVSFNEKGINLGNASLVPVINNWIKEI